MIVIPWRGGDVDRERALEWVLRRYATRHPDLDLVLGRGGEPWVKADAIADGLRQADSEVVVLADADCWTDGLESAIRAVTCGAAEWAVPHARLFRLSASGTRDYLAGQELGLCELAEDYTTGVAGGGIVVALREALLDCPLDPRFTGWGQEDTSFGYAMGTLHGKPWRGDATLVHLWHRPCERLNRAWGSAENRRLARRYEAARHRPPAMRALIEEAASLR